MAAEATIVRDAEIPTKSGLRRRRGLLVLLGATAWIAVPLLVLAILVIVRNAHGTLGLTAFAALYGCVVAIVVGAIWFLNRLETHYRRQFERAEHRPLERSPLEPFLVIVAGLAMLLVAYWVTMTVGCTTTAWQVTCSPI